VRHHPGLLAAISVTPCYEIDEEHNDDHNNNHENTRKRIRHS
jgi:hypothetical protein